MTALTVLMTITGIATMVGAGYIGSMSLEALADDAQSHLARWSEVWTDVLAFLIAACAFITALHSIASAWLQ